MIIARCSDPNDSKVLWEGGDYYLYRFDKVDGNQNLNESRLLNTMIGNDRPVLLLFHGYNCSPKDCIDFFSRWQVEADNAGINLIVCTWPSNDNAPSYWSDRKDAIKSAPRFAKFINSIAQHYLNAGKELNLSLGAHSMGNLVMWRAIKQLKSNDIIKNVYSLAADLRTANFLKGMLYGKESKKVKKFYCYYSCWDHILGLVAPLALPFARVGNTGMPAGRPSNFINVNIARMLGQKVRHGTYSQKYEIIMNVLNKVVIDE